MYSSSGTLTWVHSPNLYGDSQSSHVTMPFARTDHFHQPSDSFSRSQLERLRGVSSCSMSPLFYHAQICVCADQARELVQENCRKPNIGGCILAHLSWQFPTVPQTVAETEHNPHAHGMPFGNW